MPAVTAIVVGMALGYLCGGNVRNLANLQMRGGLLVLPCFAVQAVARGRVIEATGSSSAAMGVWILASVALTVYLLANLRVVGALVCAFGIMLNLVVVLANGGMPVGHIAAGAVQGAAADGAVAGFYRLTDVATLAGFAGDVIPVRFAGVTMLMSIGDVLLLAGVCTLVVATMTAKSFKTAM